MVLGNHSAKEAYIHMLIDALKKKQQVLECLLKITEQQENMIGSEEFSDEQFIQTITLKEKQISLLLKLDTGFEQLYQGVKEELGTNKETYKTEIILLKSQISEITDQSVKLQVLEKRNKAKLEILLSKKKRKIKDSRLSSKTVTNYYKTMAKQHEAQSYFYDKKN